MIRFCTHFVQLFYRYFYDPLIDIDISKNCLIDIDIDISQNCLIDIDISQNCLIDIDIFRNCRIDIFKNCLIDIDIFQNCLVDIDIDIFKNDLIDIDIFQKCRYIANRYSLSIYRTGLVKRGIKRQLEAGSEQTRLLTSGSQYLG